MMWVGVGVAVICLFAIALTLYLLSGAKYEQGAAETEAESLKKGRQARSEADEIMAEPAADERAWLDGVRDRRGDG
ncbi:MAG: hypothetical protein V3S01_13290 [Dehalococcoidia bacterium]